MHVGYNERLDLWVREVIDRPDLLYAEHLSSILDVTDSQIDDLFRLGCELVDFTISDKNKLAIVVTKPKSWKDNGIKWVAKHCMTDLSS